jgi:CMP-N-acetylneuraminic acid synthetase
MWRLDPVTGESTTYLDQGGAFNGPISDQEQLFFQASSLEIVKRAAALSHGSIAGKRVLGFFLPEAESHDVNVPHDWIVLEHLVRENPGLLPPIGKIT